MAEAPGSRTQPPRGGGERPVLKTGRATGPRSLPCGTHHRMALQLSAPTRAGARRPGEPFLVGGGLRRPSRRHETGVSCWNDASVSVSGETRQR